jgi:hypothetical protein
MGLDSVELVMEVEDAFAIDIPNEAAEAMTTIGAVTTYVTTRLAPKAGRCRARWCSNVSARSPASNSA